MGIRGNVTPTNLAYANELRNWRVYEALAQILICKARRLYDKEAGGLDLAAMIYAVDASTVDLCRSIFPWLHSEQPKPLSNGILKSI